MAIARVATQPNEILSKVLQQQSAGRGHAFNGDFYMSTFGLRDDVKRWQISIRFV